MEKPSTLASTLEIYFPILLDAERPKHMKTVKQCKNCAWRMNRADPFFKELGVSWFRCCLKGIPVDLEDSCRYWIGFYGDPVQLPVIYTPSYFNLELDVTPEDLIARMFPSSRVK